MKPKPEKPKPPAAPGEEMQKTAKPVSPMLQVYGWLLDGQSKANVLDAIHEIYPGENPARLLSEAQQSFALLSKEPADSILGWCMEATRELYRQLKDVGDYEAALRAVAQLHKLIESRQK